MTEEKTFDSAEEFMKAAKTITEKLCGSVANRNLTLKMIFQTPDRQNFTTKTEVIINFVPLESKDSLVHENEQLREEIMRLRMEINLLRDRQVGRKRETK
jgi:hypothetical protein